MKEIGGYLELENFFGKEYYPDAIALNTARNAFVYLAKNKNITKVYIPYYLCDSVSNVCVRENIKFEYYHITENFLPKFHKVLGKNEFLYIVNFFGQLDDEKIKGYKEEYKNIILDNVQAFFQKPINDVDTIYSCRKFFGVPDGAYLFSNGPLLDLPEDISKDRMTHLLGRFEGEGASQYYKYFQKNDALFDDLALMRMSRLTRNLLKVVDYDAVIERRTANWNLLDQALGEKNKLNLTTPVAPYMYPFYTKDAVNIKKILLQKRIYVPTLWPNVLSFENCNLEKDYAQNILPLPCDQRYGIEEMGLLVREISKMLS